MTLSRLLREPLLHFAVLGIGLFALYSWVNPGGGSGHEIVVGPERLAAIDRQFESLWQRPPSRPERQDLIESFVRDEVLYREGLAMGLNRDDPVIRRRVAQKVTFLAQEATPAPASDADLQAWLQAHAADYREPDRYWLQQVYFDPRHNGGDGIAAAQRRLQSQSDRWRGEGDPTMLPAELADVPAEQIDAQFGAGFAQQLQGLPAGGWQGPIASGYGPHLVRLIRHQPGRIPPLADVRDQVERDLLASRAQQAQADLYRRLRERYRVQVLDGAPKGDAGKVAVMP